jgi:hypothetical protein
MVLSLGKELILFGLTTIFLFQPGNPLFQHFDFCFGVGLFGALGGYYGCRGVIYNLKLLFNLF